MKVLNSTFKSNFAQRQCHPMRLPEKKIRGFFLSVLQAGFYSGHEILREKKLFTLEILLLA
jgi:hypothetical protein